MSAANRSAPTRRLGLKPERFGARHQCPSPLQPSQLGFRRRELRLYDELTGQLERGLLPAEGIDGRRGRLPMAAHHRRGIHTRQRLCEGYLLRKLIETNRRHGSLEPSAHTDPALVGDGVVDMPCGVGTELGHEAVSFQPVEGGIDLAHIERSIMPCPAFEFDSELVPVTIPLVEESEKALTDRHAYTVYASRLFGLPIVVDDGYRDRKLRRELAEQ